MRMREFEKIKYTGVNEIGMVRKDLVSNFRKQISLCKIPNRLDFIKEDLVFDFFPYFSKKLNSSANPEDIKANC